MMFIFFKIIYKILNTYFKVKIKEYFDKYLIDSDNILITTKINQNYIIINIYNAELMFPSINNINIIKCDIYNINIKIPIKIKSIKIKITGINLSYEIFDKILEKSNIFTTSFNKEINTINNEFIDLLENTIKEEALGIIIIEKWINSIIDSTKIKICDITINDITNNIRTKIDNIEIRTNLNKIKIKKISFWNDINKFFEIRNIIINENLMKYKIYKIKLYLDIKCNLISILNLLIKYKKFLSIFQTEIENEKNINIYFECFIIIIKYSVNNLNNIYFNLTNILLNKNKLSINDLKIYFLENINNIKRLYDVSKLDKIIIDLEKKIINDIDKLNINIYRNIHKEWIFLYDDIIKCLNQIKDLNLSKKKIMEKNINLLVKNLNDEILDNYLTYNINFDNNIDDYIIIKNENVSDKLRIIIININLYSNYDRNENVLLKISNFKIEYDIEILQYQLIIDNIEIIDNIIKSKWYKFMYKIKNKQPFLHIKLNNKLINNTDKKYNNFELYIELDGIILNIDQDCFDFIKNIINSNILYRDNINKLNEKNSQIYFSKIDISPIYINLSYKPKKINLNNLLSGNTEEALQLNTIYDLEININSIVLFHILGYEDSLNQIYDKFLNDFIENNWDCIMKIGPTKYIYNISNICYNIFNINITNKTSYLNLLKKIGKKGGKTIRNISNEILELTTRTVVSVQTILDIIVKNENENNKSKYNDAPKSIKDGLNSAYKSIKNIKSINDNNKTISQKILLPLASITEATSQTLIGIQSTINKKKITINENRYK